MKIIYLTSWYEETNFARKQELIRCIHNTYASKEVDEIVVLREKHAPLNDLPSIYYKNILHRPTYNDFFEFANVFAKKGDIVIIANTDIYPEQGTKKYLSNLKENECYALSRWDEDTNGKKTLLNQRDTADVWIFRAPIKKIEGDFYLGMAGCDNAIAERITKAGYNVLNPSKTIQFNHVHNSQVRNYNPNNRVKKPYLLIAPHHLNEIAQKDFLN